MTTIAEDTTAISYPISSRYCRNWGMVEALREVIANALDSMGNVSLSYSSGMFHIKDDGPGFSRRCLVLGEAEYDKSESQIGQFGEGLKMAMLVVASHRRGWELHTTGFSIPRITMSDAGLGVDTLNVHVRGPRQEKETGTRVSVECTAEEAQAAVDLFAYISSREFDRNRQVMVPAGEGYGKSEILLDLPGKQAIYVNGLRTAEIEALFSYNIRDAAAKEAMNRDRTRMDRSSVEHGVCTKLLAALSEEALLARNRRPIHDRLVDALEEGASKAKKVEMLVLSSRQIAKNCPSIVEAVLRRLGVPEHIEMDSILLGDGVNYEAKVEELPKGKFYLVRMDTPSSQNLGKWAGAVCSRLRTVMQAYHEHRHQQQRRAAELARKRGLELDAFHGLARVKRPRDRVHAAQMGRLEECYSHLCLITELCRHISEDKQMGTLPLFLFEPVDSSSPLGVYVSHPACIGISTRLVDGSMDGWKATDAHFLRVSGAPYIDSEMLLMDVLAHELAHHISGAEDGTREHFNAMSLLLVGAWRLKEIYPWLLSVKRDPFFTGKTAPILEVTQPSQAASFPYQATTMLGLLSRLDRWREEKPAAASPTLSKPTAKTLAGLDHVATKNVATARLHLVSGYKKDYGKSWTLYFVGHDYARKTSERTRHLALVLLKVRISYRQSKKKGLNGPRHFEAYLYKGGQAIREYQRTIQWAYVRTERSDIKPLYSLPAAVREVLALPEAED